MFTINNLDFEIISTDYVLQNVDDAEYVTSAYVPAMFYTDKLIYSYIAMRLTNPVNKKSYEAMCMIGITSLQPSVEADSIGTITVGTSMTYFEIIKDVLVKKESIETDIIKTTVRNDTKPVDVIDACLDFVLETICNDILSNEIVQAESHYIDELLADIDDAKGPIQDDDLLIN